MVHAVVSVSLGLIFMASAAAKLRRPKSFILTVLNYQILPDSSARLYARLLPFAELLTACLLIGGIIPLAASVVAWLLVLSFIVGIAVNIARGRRIECGCFGDGRYVGWPLLLQDGGLLGMITLTIVLAKPGELIAPWSVGRVAGTGGYPSVVSLIGCLAALGLAIDAAFLRERRTPRSSVGGKRRLPRDGDRSAPRRIV